MLVSSYCWLQPVRPHCCRHPQPSLRCCTLFTPHLNLGRRGGIYLPRSPPRAQQVASAQEWTGWPPLTAWLKDWVASVMALLNPGLRSCVGGDGPVFDEKALLSRGDGFQSLRTFRTSGLTPGLDLPHRCCELLSLQTRAESAPQPVDRIQKVSSVRRGM